jgi:gluconolactonase
VFREGGAPNGLLFDHQGRLVVCEAANRRVIRLETDASITVLADTYEGKRFNSPNDLAIDSQGRIYFSDPRYGKRDDMEMRDDTKRAVEGVYRIDAPGQVTRVLTHEVDRPNGLAIAPRDKYLYVADNNNDAGGARKLWRFDLGKDGSVNPATQKLLFDWKTSRGPDGIKLDRKGRIFVAAGRNRPRPPHETAEPYTGGVYVLSPAGKLLETIPITDDEVTNCAFGGNDRKTLFITAGGNLWSIRVKTAGAGGARPPTPLPTTAPVRDR